MHRRSRYAPVRRWQPLTDAEWDALPPHVPLRNGPGRPLKRARGPIDAIFWGAAAGCAWRGPPPRFGKPDTASHHFRRLPDAGLRERPLRALAPSHAPAALLAVEHRIRAACRRVGRRGALRTVTWARRLGFISALRAPPDMPPDVDLSERVHRWIRSVLEDAFEHRPAAVPPGFLRDARRRLALCGGRVRVPRAMLPG